MTIVLDEISVVFALINLNCLHFLVIKIVYNAMDWIAFVEGLDWTFASDYFNLSSTV